MISADDDGNYCPCLLQRVLMTFKVLTYQITKTEFLCAPVSHANTPDCVHITFSRVAVCMYVKDAQIPHGRSPSN